MAEPLPSEMIDGRYRVLSRLGAGGMADVFLAEDEQLSRQVALKLLHRRFAADPGFVERFRREAQAAASLQHPNVVSVYDRGSFDDTYYIAMEYLPGRTLKQLIREEAPLDPLRAIDIALQILRAARFAHRRGVIHRDLKPHNVIVDESDQAKVTDFGIARAGASDMTETGSIMGTAQYLSPEQAQGHAVGPASDVYSVGVVLYEMLTGRVPFDGDSPVAIALKHVSQAPVAPSAINPAVPPELDQTVLWALNKDPADRPASADELIAVLEHCRATIASGAAPERTASMAAVVASGRAPGEVARLYAASATNGTGSLPATPPPARPRRRRWLPWALAALVVLLIAAAAVVAYLLSRPVQYRIANVGGEQAALAMRTLRAEHFQVSVIHQPSASRPGTVIGETPPAGTLADRGSNVTLTVSSGPADVAVPEVTGLTVPAATRTLRRAGLRIADRVPRSSMAFAAGLAIGTVPRVATLVPHGYAVTLLVSSGPPTVAVPRVIGESQTAAAAALAKAGFNPVPRNQQSSTVPAGDVISQSPAPGVREAPGATVTITVAVAPQTATVPPVVGDPQSGAVSALRAAGFRVVVEHRSVIHAQRGGVVISQAPAGTATAQKGATVTIVVGRYTPPSSSSSSSSSSSQSQSSTTPAAGSTAPGAGG
ncbi:MAG TPA: Stk1 family PASTA domain-containing Ser/Thr kinase [Solirubrobacteraceae bacterium]|nr:Stk1 family PASTA domain-containing Ser/Thr kinase [Solirubrobacteraceae bacterium]